MEHPAHSTRLGEGLDTRHLPGDLLGNHPRSQGPCGPSPLKPGQTLLAVPNGEQTYNSAAASPESQIPPGRQDSFVMAAAWSQLSVPEMSDVSADAGPAGSGGPGRGHAGAPRASCGS